MEQNPNRASISTHIGNNGKNMVRRREHFATKSVLNIKEIYFMAVTSQDASQEASDVPRDRKILKPGDYTSNLDHYPGDQKTMVSKSKSLVPPF